MKRILLVFMFILAGLSFTNPSYAVMIPIDFSSTDIVPLPPDSSPGDYDHVLSTPYGDITFNGRIWEKLSGNQIEDHTPGNGGYFLKNTLDRKVVEMDFSFDVNQIDLYWYAYEGTEAYMAVFDINGNRLNRKSRDGKDKWKGALSFGGYSSPIRSLKFWVKENGDRIGNGVAIDDVTLYHSSVPEPATMALFGIGLLGAGAIRRRKSA